MPIPANKEELLTAIQEHYAQLQTELRGIPAELTASRTLEGHAKGTLMSPENLVAYLIGWGELLLKWQNRKSAGLPVDFPETGYKWNELGRLAQKFYTDYEHIDFQALLTRLDETVARILEIVASGSNAGLYETAWYDKWTLGRLIQLNTAAPFKNARDRIRRWKKSEAING